MNVYIAKRLSRPRALLLRPLSQEAGSAGKRTRRRQTQQTQQQQVQNKLPPLQGCEGPYRQTDRQVRSVRKPTHTKKIHICTKIWKTFCFCLGFFFSFFDLQNHVRRKRTKMRPLLLVGLHRADISTSPLDRMALRFSLLWKISAPMFYSFKMPSF